MSKKNLNLASAIALFKQGKESRDIKLTEAEIAKYIDSQISLKSQELTELKETLEETSEENDQDLKDTLLNLDDSNIASRDARKQTAERYVEQAIDHLLSNKNYVETVKEAISDLEDEISLLEELRTLLEDITVEVEK